LIVDALVFLRFGIEETEAHGARAPCVFLFAILIDMTPEGSIMTIIVQ